MLIATIMCGIAIYLFGQTQRGARVSLSRAQLMVTASTVDSRLRMDAASMLGPNRTLASASVSGVAAGCLVIVPGLREGYLPLPNGQMSKNKVRLRSDQLVFISKRDPTTPHPWVSLIPLGQNAEPVLASVSPSSSWEARIWYGAVKDGNYAGGDGSVNDASTWAHLWKVGRQAKLLVQDQKGGGLDCTVTPSDDTTSGGLVKPTLATAWGGLKDTALAGNWSDTDYLTNLIGLGIPDSQTNYTNPPPTTPKIDLKALQQGDNASGIQLDDVANSHLRLFENCSEFVIQWAGDLDKDGKIDTYPKNHPLAGSIIWYPEELHNKGATYDGYAAARLDANLLAKYNAIKANDWKKSFPAGFAPSTSRFGGHAYGAKGFEFEYGDTDHATSPAPTGTPVVPKPYVFRFDDDQYRLVRYGFRQDGSAYKGTWDGWALPGAPAGKHCFPYPPLANAPTAWNSADPTAASLYSGAAPDGPYPCAATAAVAAGRNFGDLMGAQMLPGDAMNGTTPKYRTGGTGNPFLADGLTPDPNQFGHWVKVTNPAPEYAWPVSVTLAVDTTSPPDNWIGLETPATPGNPAAVPPIPATQDLYHIYANGNLVWQGGVRYQAKSRPVGQPAIAPSTDPASNSANDPPPPNAAYWDPSPAPSGSDPVWPYYSGGNLVAIRQIDGTVIASVARPAAYDTTPDTPLPLPCVANRAGEMAQAYDSNNNYTKTYTDLWAEYLKTVNDPAKAADTNPLSRDDWRMPQSDWPKLLRIRVRLHDSQGLVTSYSDEALVNGRDDDGDGQVDNPEEGRISGMWFEYILAVPYPMDPTPRAH